MKKTVQLTRMSAPRDDSGVSIDFKENRVNVAPTTFAPVGMSKDSTTNPLLVTSIPEWKLEYDFDYTGSIGIYRVGTVTQTKSGFHAIFEQTFDVTRTYIKSIDRSDNDEGDSFSIIFDKMVAYQTIAGKKIGQLIENGDRVLGTEYSDSIKLTDKSEIILARDGTDYLDGRGGNDRLSGEAGADRLLGGEGHDLLQGGLGDDVLNGESGSDILHGGAGRDKLAGGTGADTFIFKSLKESTSSQRDTIYDFKRTDGDKVDLKAIDANLKLEGDQAFKLIGAESFHKKAGELRFLKENGGTYIFGDVNGDGKADFSVKFDDVVTLVKGDFIL